MESAQREERMPEHMEGWLNGARCDMIDSERLLIGSLSIAPSSAPRAYPRTPVRALFWRLRIEYWARGPRGWLLQLPLIEQLKGAVWAVALHLSRTGPCWFAPAVPT